MDYDKIGKGWGKILNGLPIVLEMPPGGVGTLKPWAKELLDGRFPYALFTVRMIIQ